MPSYDLVIRRGVVIDGSGSPGVRADVGVRAGRIVRIGPIPERGLEDIDAEGHVVCPGFVEGHTHFDAQVFWDPLGASSCWHGVTTAVMGNCGFTLAPVRRNAEHLVAENLERAEDIPASVLAAGVPWDWETFAEYLDAVDRQPKAINYASYVGHSALRTWAMGERAFDGPASDDELSIMESELRAAMAAGAIGLSTSRSENHCRVDGGPVASRLAAWGELCRLVAVLSDLGTGILELSQEPAAMSDDLARREEWYNRLHALCVDSGVPVTFGTLSSMLDFLDTTAAAGGRVFGQCNGRGTAAVLSFRTHLPFDRLPEWASVRSRSLAEQRKMLLDPFERARLVAAAHTGDYGHIVGADPRKPEFHTISVLQRAVPPNPSVADAAAARGLDPVEYMIERGLETDFHQMFLQPFVDDSEDDLLRALRHPRTVLAFSDSGAHVSQIIDCSVYTHLLAYWVRARGAFTLEEAVAMLTRDPATAWGFVDRGFVREGFIADLNVFDPATVAPLLPTIEFDLPGGVARLEQRSTGFLATIVAGEVVLRDGEPTGARPGRLIRAS